MDQDPEDPAGRDHQDLGRPRYAAASVEVEEEGPAEGQASVASLIWTLAPGWASGPADTMVVLGIPRSFLARARSLRSAQNFRDLWKLSSSLIPIEAVVAWRSDAYDLMFRRAPS